MTKYYVELNQYSNDANISLISNEVLKEVLEDFCIELNNRKITINYTSCCKNDSDQFNCYEMHAYSRFAGCGKQCKECKNKETNN